MDNKDRKKMEASGLRCAWCHCQEEEHEEYRECPLFQGNYLCNICCDYDIESDDITGKFDLEVQKVLKERFDVELTFAEIIKICSKCGKRRSSSVRVIYVDPPE